MLKNKRAALRDVTLETGFVLTKEQRSAAFDLLRQTCVAAFNRAADVRIMAVRTTDFAFQNRMVVRQFELRADFKVTLETSLGRTPRIHDLALVASGRDVKTSRTVTSFAAHFLRVFARRF